MENNVTSRKLGVKEWKDETLKEWKKDDYRIFVGNLGNEKNDENLVACFRHNDSLLKAKIIRDKKTKKSRGYGFVSFWDSADYIKAMKEMQGKYLGKRPMKLEKSKWKDRNRGK